MLTLVSLFLVLALLGAGFLLGWVYGYRGGEIPFLLAPASPVQNSILDYDEWLDFANRKVSGEFQPVEVPLNGSTVILRNEYEVAAYDEHCAFNEFNSFCAECETVLPANHNVPICDICRMALEQPLVPNPDCFVSDGCADSTCKWCYGEF